MGFGLGRKDSKIVRSIFIKDETVAATHHHHHQPQLTARYGGSHFHFSTSVLITSDGCRRKITFSQCHGASALCPANLCFKRTVGQQRQKCYLPPCCPRKVPSLCAHLNMHAVGIDFLRLNEEIPSGTHNACGAGKQARESGRKRESYITIGKFLFSHTTSSVFQKGRNLEAAFPTGCYHIALVIVCTSAAHIQCPAVVVNWSES